MSESTYQLAWGVNLRYLDTYKTVVRRAGDGPWYLFRKGRWHRAAPDEFALTELAIRGLLHRIKADRIRDLTQQIRRLRALDPEQVALGELNPRFLSHVMEMDRS